MCRAKLILVQEELFSTLVGTKTRIRLEVVYFLRPINDTSFVLNTQALAKMRQSKSETF